MLSKDYSQIPVYRGTVLAALLTTDTIARWVAGALKTDGIMEGAPVQDVLNQAEFADNYQLLDPSATVLEALGCFDACFRRGKRLDAILIAKDVKKTSSPVGIITAFDIPKLNDSLR